MRYRSLTTRGHSEGGINVTPLIDVVMCLIIFFLIVAKLAATQGPNVALPTTARGTPDQQRRAIIVSITPKDRSKPLTLATVMPAEEGDAPSAAPAPSAASARPFDPALLVTADGAPMASPTELETYLSTRSDEESAAAPNIAAAARNLPVDIRAARDLPYAAVAPVLAACKRAGLVAVRLVTERPVTP
ncbi:hypothetical protein BH11PLA1_BH11PLA1_05960 [soil metagenome]